MLILLSPAKTLRTDIDTQNGTQAAFLKQSAQIMEALKNLSADEIARIMKINPQLAQLNYDRFQNWNLPLNKSNSYPAALLFDGPVYQGLDFKSLHNVDAIERGQERIRILSGLYGILRPRDLIAPYRLEMGTKWQIDNRYPNLYHFWGDLIKDKIQKDLHKSPEPLIVNLASWEYARAAKLAAISSARIVTPVFKDRTKTKQYKIMTAFAKRARGLMARFLILEDYTSAEDLKAFQLEGYKFSSSESTPDQPVFLRDH